MLINSRQFCFDYDRDQHRGLKNDEDSEKQRSSNFVIS